MSDSRPWRFWGAQAQRLGEAAETLLEARRPNMARVLSPRERVVEGVAAAGFVAAASALAATATPNTSVRVGPALALLATFVLLARVRIAVGAGFTAPTQLAVVPLLLLLPPGLAPALVGLALLLDCLLDTVVRRRPFERALSSLADGWYVVGPALLLAVTAPRGALGHTGLALWLAALGLQLVGELISSTIREELGRGVSVRQHIASICQVWIIDVLLAPVGLLAAFASQARPYAFLLILPLVAGFSVFAHDRARRIDRAYALVDDLHRERDAVLASQQELRESRVRLVQAADVERRRIERDLHDGAQQRLAGLLLKARLGRRARPGDVEPVLDDLEQGLAIALSELRTLAAGILPPVLSDHGLPAALEELASTAPIPLVVRADGVGRLPAHIEQAAYFVAAEGLANMIKHARATKGSARIAQDNETLIIEIADNGIGGANTAAGSGLRGLNDRVGALDGLLRCDSPPGGGTVVRAESPCAS